MNQAQCPSCQHIIQYGDDVAGKESNCPNCNMVLQLPGVVAPTPSNSESKAGTSTKPLRTKKVPKQKPPQYDLPPHNLAQESSAPEQNQPEQNQPVQQDSQPVQPFPQQAQPVNPVVEQVMQPVPQQVVAQQPAAQQPVLAVPVESQPGQPVAQPVAQAVAQPIDQVATPTYQDPSQAKTSASPKTSPLVLWGIVGGALVAATIVVVVIINLGGGSNQTAGNETDEKANSSNDASKAANANASLSRKKSKEAIQLLKKRSEVVGETTTHHLAFNLLNEAIELDPNNVDALVARANQRLTHEIDVLGKPPTLQRLNEICRADIQDLSHALSIGPERAELYAERGQQYHYLAIEEAEEGSYEKAKADFEKAIELDPNHKLASIWKNELALIQDSDPSARKSNVFRKGAPTKESNILKHIPIAPFMRETTQLLPTEVGTLGGSAEFKVFVISGRSDHDASAYFQREMGRNRWTPLGVNNDKAKYSRRSASGGANNVCYIYVANGRVTIELVWKD